MTVERRPERKSLHKSQDIMPVDSLSTKGASVQARVAIISAVSAAVSFRKHWELQVLLHGQ